MVQRRSPRATIAPSPGRRHDRKRFHHARHPRTTQPSSHPGPSRRRRVHRRMGMRVDEPRPRHHHHRRRRRHQRQQQRGRHRHEHRHEHRHGHRRRRRRRRRGGRRAAGDRARGSHPRRRTACGPTCPSRRGTAATARRRTSWCTSTARSKKIAIYLEGGGACFNDASCKLLNIDLPSYVLGQGIFNFTRADNPIGDWNIFYVPYCTGDVHAGANPTGYPGPITGPQDFTGYTNLELYLSRILATVPDATDELLMGSSAGGFGVGPHGGPRRAQHAGERGAVHAARRLRPADVEPVHRALPPGRVAQGVGASTTPSCRAAARPARPGRLRVRLDAVPARHVREGRPPRRSSWAGSSRGRATPSSAPSTASAPTTAPSPRPSRSAAPSSRRGSSASDRGAADDHAVRHVLRGRAPRTPSSSGQSSGLLQGVGLLGGLYDTAGRRRAPGRLDDDLLAHKQAAHVGP